MSSPRILALIILLAAITAILAPVRAQDFSPQNFVISPYAIVDVSQLPAPGPQTMQTKVRGRHFPDAALLAAEKQALAKAGGKPKPSASPSPVPTATPTPSLSTSESFNGIGLLGSGGYVPPDTQVAAGPNHVFEAVNLEGQIFSKAGGAVKSFSLYSFFNISTSDSITDPRVLYDAPSGHWFMITSTFGPSSAYGWNLAVSAGTDPTDPTGTWYVYHYPTVGSFPDFPKIGLNSDKVVITGDAFSGNTFLGTEFVVFNKSEVMTGSDTDVTYYPPGQGDFAIEPAQHLASIGTATNHPDTLFMASVANPSASTVRIWSVTGVPGSIQPVAVATASLAISTLTTPPNAAQGGTSKLVDTNDNALLDAVFRDGSPGSLWVSANDGCTPQGDIATRSCLRLIEVSIASGTPTVSQDFDYSALGQYFFYPAIRTDSTGNLFVVFNGSSSSKYISVYGDVQKTTDTADTLEPPVLLKSGSGAYTESARWGDYSGAGIDPSNDTVWLGGEYPTSCGFLIRSCWGTWIASVYPHP
jgi:hypothetical protein